jgi:hypothetical protein
MSTTTLQFASRLVCWMHIDNRYHLQSEFHQAAPVAAGQI